MHPLRQRIFEGEGPTLDFKQTISSARKIAKTLAAFANCRGGSLLVGVQDNGRIRGAEPHEEAYMIESAANFYCDPVVGYDLVQHPYKHLKVLEVVVHESVEKPHGALGDDGKYWVYIRVNDKTMLASKTTVDVLRKENKQEGSYIEYSSKETALLEYLTSNERITLKEFSKMLNISRRRANKILVNLISAGIIRQHFSDKYEFYTLS